MRQIPSPALAELLARDGFELDEIEPAPPMPQTELVRPRIPRPDWQKEERERREREQARPDPPLEELPGRFPPPKRETP